MSVFNCSRVLLGSSVWRDSRRLISSSAVRRKALENWTRPNIGEIGTPTESWAAVYAKNQKKFNIQLLAGVGLFGLTFVTAYNTVFANSTPDFVHKTGFVTTLPKDEEQLSLGVEATPSEYIAVVEEAVKIVEEVVEVVKDEEQLSLGVEATPSEYIAVVEEAVKIVEEVVEVVKETVDVVKETIESVDEIVLEVKKIEDETKAIIEESKEIAADSSKLVTDLEDVVKEGAEIITEVKDVIENVVESVTATEEEKTPSSNEEEKEASN